MIKVLVVDDSAFMRKVISDIINSDPELEVVDRARNGIDALQKIPQVHPDVVTLDVEMPELDGLSVLKKIMESHPLPVVMLSSLTAAGTEQTVRALELGAVDFLMKPSGQISLDIDKISTEIIKKIKVAAGTKKNIKKLCNNTKQIAVSLPSSYQPWTAGELKKLVLIGTSTGGPKALHQVLPRLSADLDAAILVVQHMPAGFTRSLAERLDSLSQIRVKEAEDGEEIKSGCAYIAPGDYHLKVQASACGKTLHVRLNQNPPRGGHRPSVDEMFESVAGQSKLKMVCVVMTGMGQDGTTGLKYMKEKGAKVIAEHQSTCIVYGMPKAAIEAGRVDRVAPLHEISYEIIKMLQS
ncbi:MAG: chemotaxis response regulator protein-glutamate methylesterase [Bacillota bacterium]|nr:chemotaxis response regulator protein-glutamate methylesterase [Bacillota bacterium]